MSYKVKLNVFEGPFDLLVYLIENAEMSIYDIQISEITEQYIAHVEMIRENDVETATEFLVLAATLIEIKSKMLLPRNQESAEAILMDDPRKDLVQKLLEYKKFKTIAELLEAREENYQNICYKPQEDLSEFIIEEGIEVIDISIPQFIRTFKLFIDRRRKIEDIHRNYGGPVKAERISVKEKVNYINKFMNGKPKATFFSLVQDCKDRYEVAVTFMALLDMMRNGQIRVKQNVNFGEIIIKLQVEEAIH